MKKKKKDEDNDLHYKMEYISFVHATYTGILSDMKLSRRLEATRNKIKHAAILRTCTFILVMLCALSLKGHAQAKIITKSVIIFWLINMTI